MINEGHALWLPGRAEDATNVRYSVLTQRAAAAQRGLFSPNYCGIGPNEGHPIRLWANWDADGNDGEDVNGEWVKIRNYDPVNPLPLGGWYVRDTGLRRFTFPPGAVASRRTPRCTVYAGQGESFGSEFFWNLTAPVFENIDARRPRHRRRRLPVRPAGRHPRLDDLPLPDQLRRPRTRARSRSTQPEAATRSSRCATTRPSAIDLENYLLKSKPYSYAFPPGSDPPARRDDARLHPGRPGRRHRSSRSTGA